MQRQHHTHLLPGDVAETVLLPGDPQRARFIAERMDEAHFVAHNRQYVTYTGEYQGVPVSVLAPGIGCPAVAIAVEELINVGARNFIRVGTGGILQRHIPVGSVIIATAAVRGDGTSREYFPLEYPAVADLHVLEALVAAADRRGLQPYVGIIRSHDAFYMESVLARGDYLTREKTWIENGVLAVENESSLLFALATARRCRAGTILAVGGHHHFPDKVLFADQMQDLLHQITLVALDAAASLAEVRGRRFSALSTH
jgi:uridine phosphorylase